MTYIKHITFSLALAAVLVVPAHGAHAQAQLTNQQIQAILGVLESRGASQDVIANVTRALGQSSSENDSSQSKTLMLERTFHPADTNKDNRIVQSELLAYVPVAAQNPAHGNLIRIASEIVAGGERYSYDNVRDRYRDARGTVIDFAPRADLANFEITPGNESAITYEDSTLGKYTITFSLTPRNADAYIPQKSNQDQGIMWNITGDTFSGEVSSVAMVRGAQTKGGMFHLKKDVKYVVQLSVELDNVTGQAGSFGIEIEGIQFSETQDHGNMVTITAGTSELKTLVRRLNKGAQADNDNPAQNPTDSDDSTDYKQVAVAPGFYPITEAKYPDLFTSGTTKGVMRGSENNHVIEGDGMSPPRPTVKQTNDNFTTYHDYCRSSSTLREGYIADKYNPNVNHIDVLEVDAPDGYICVNGQFVANGEDRFHDADMNQDNRISRSELNRVKAMYENGGYQCSPEEDTMHMPGDAHRNCRSFNGDTNQNWKIDFSELQRVIQLHNASGYDIARGTEDGFAPFTEEEEIVHNADIEIQGMGRGTKTWVRGTSKMITWNPQAFSGGEVDIVICRGRCWEAQSAIANTGAAQVTIEDNRPLGDRYHVRVREPGNGGTMRAGSQIFTVIERERTSMNPLSALASVFENAQRIMKDIVGVLRR